MTGYPIDMQTRPEVSGFAIYGPGHTPGWMTDVVGDSASVDDTLFMPDGGSARADFPGGDAGLLYDSIEEMLALTDETRFFMCHDNDQGGRVIQWETTGAEQEASNIQDSQGTTRETFIGFRTERDAALEMPRAIILSLQVNVRAGQLPPADDSGKRFLKVPVNGL
jgi:glyoxylase-like metal-dependent hydrolase (beta-lactamase superfamily II)